MGEVGGVCRPHRGRAPTSIYKMKNRNTTKPKDANGNPKAIIPAAIHFKQPGHNFNKHAKFTLV